MDYGFPHYTEDELRALDHEALVWAYCLLQARFEHLRDKDLPDLEEKYRISLVKRFGRSSEKSSVMTGHSQEKKPEEEQEKEPERKGSGENAPDRAGRKRPVRHAGCAEKVKENLKVVDEQIELTPEELTEIFGEGVPYKDDPSFEKTCDLVCSLPVTHYIRRYHIHVYRGGGKIVSAASHMTKMKSGSLMTPDLMAEIINDRCVLQLPMNRIAQDYSRNGFPLTRQTMARWGIDIGFQYIEPLVCRMLELLKAQKYLHADETFMTVGHTLAGERKECRQWVFRTSSLLKGPTIIVFWFDETRATDVLRELFWDEKELFIICDAYISYKTFAKEKNGDVTIANCYTHARRNFTDIIKAIPGFKKLSEKEQNGILSCRIVRMIDRIFELERGLKDLDADRRLAVRQEKGTPLVDELFGFLHSLPDSDFDKSSKLYEAVNYMKNQEDCFRVFLKDGRVPIHNSSCEQAIIPFSLGRNNWKCIDSIDGAITLGYYYSLTETAKANGAIPFYYLKYLFERLPELFRAAGGTPSSESYDELMPWTDDYRSYEKRAIASLSENLKKWETAS